MRLGVVMEFAFDGKEEKIALRSWLTYSAKQEALLQEHLPFTGARALGCMRRAQPSSAFINPRRFVTARQACNAITAFAPAGIAHHTHSTLLARKTQNPIFRRALAFDPTSQAARIDAAKAGHWMKSARSMDRPICQITSATRPCSCASSAVKYQSLSSTRSWISSAESDEPSDSLAKPSL